MRTTIVVPKTADSYNEAVRFAKTELSERYGGYTAYEGDGGWVNYEGELVEEPVTVIESFGDVVKEGGITMIAERVREITGETKVMATVDGEKILV